jgi:hypothetical protein
MVVISQSKGLIILSTYLTDNIIREDIYSYKLIITEIYSLQDLLHYKMVGHLDQVIQL